MDTATCDGSRSPEKVASGIAGFDRIAEGGLPRGRATVVLGGPGAGKTVFGLQVLVHGACACDEPGLLIAFEESPDSVVADAAGFGWDLAGLRAHGGIAVLDAGLGADSLKSGDFDLAGLLAAADDVVERLGVRRVVFDALDVLLGVLGDPLAQRRELYRLHDWLVQRALTGVITARLAEGGEDVAERFSFIHYMADCTVLLRHYVQQRVGLRDLRILKYRGSGFRQNEFPLSIDGNGIQVAAFADEEAYPASDERLSSGVDRLDTMLAGGYLRGSCVLVTGAPGSAKSILGGCFARSACARSEPTLVVSFDEAPAEMIRNLASVNIQLQPYVEQGLLRLHFARSEVCNADEHLLMIKRLVEEHTPRCLVVDPLSALLKAGGPLAAINAAVELMRYAKRRGITLYASSLPATAIAGHEEAELRISSTADAWLQLSYEPRGGERNRALTIIKARGTGHSNQVRELVLGDEGVSLTDVYSAGGEVLMGTMRLEKELADQRERELACQEVEVRQRDLALAEAEVQARIASLQRELEGRRAELERLLRQQELRDRRSRETRARIEALRGVDADPPTDGEAGTRGER